MRGDPKWRRCAPPGSPPWASPCRPRPRWPSNALASLDLNRLLESEFRICRLGFDFTSSGVNSPPRVWNPPPRQVRARDPSGLAGGARALQGPPPGDLPLGRRGGAGSALSLPLRDTYVTATSPDLPLCDTYVTAASPNLP
eukprot:330997-Prorocentrum_minimum.AAC.2